MAGWVKGFRSMLHFRRKPRIDKLQREKFEDPAPKSWSMPTVAGKKAILLVQKTVTPGLSYSVL